MAQIIRVNGTAEPLDIPENDQLDCLQEAVGGYIEIVYLDDGRLMILDDEGKLKARSVLTRRRPASMAAIPSSAMSSWQTATKLTDPTKTKGPQDIGGLPFKTPAF